MEGSRRRSAGRQGGSTRNILPASLLIIRRSHSYPRGRASQKFLRFFQKKLTVPKIFAQCQKLINSYLYTLRRTIAYALSNTIANLNTCIPFLNTCITYLNTLTRLSALGSIS